MGGVDLADMRRLNCNSTIMGLHRWWLKLFFYLLDVGTSNALVLYRAATNDKINVVKYKEKLVQMWIGDRLSHVERPIVLHKLVRRENNQRLGCAYCSTFGVTKITRFRCGHPQCMIPLCSVGTGTTEQDCFALAHTHEEVRRAVCMRYTRMTIKANHKRKSS